MRSWRLVPSPGFASDISDSSFLSPCTSRSQVVFSAMYTTRTAVCLALLCLAGPGDAAAELTDDSGPQAQQDQETSTVPVSRLRFFVDAALLSPGPYVLALGAGVIDEVS